MNEEVELVIAIGVAILMGPFLSVIATPIFCLFRKLWYVPLMRKKYVEKAIKQGHVVTAKLTETYDQIDSDGYTGRQVGIYTYECRGRTYKCRRSSQFELPREITLYYQRKPGKATDSHSIGLYESRWFLYYIVLSILLSIATLCVIMHFGVDTLDEFL